MKCVIIFRNNNNLVFDCDEVTVDINKIDGKVASIGWKGARDIKPMYIDLEEVIAVFTAKNDKEQEHE